MSPPPASRGETTLTMIQTIDQLVSHAHDLFQQAFDLFHDSKHGIVASEREIAASLNVTDIADVYVTAGYTKGEAVIKAKEDLEGLNRRVDTIEGRIKRMVAEVMYEK
jgi:hypothetical protein